MCCGKKSTFGFELKAREKAESYTHQLEAKYANENFFSPTTTNCSSYSSFYKLSDIIEERTSQLERRLWLKKEANRANVSLQRQLALALVC